MCNIHLLCPLTLPHCCLLSSLVLGTSLTASANIFFAVVKPSETYWAYGLPSAILSVFGADFVFSTGTLFIAKIALPHEQSVAGALFQTMTQVRDSSVLQILFVHITQPLAWNLFWSGDNDPGFQSHPDGGVSQVGCYRWRWF